MPNPVCDNPLRILIVEDEALIVMDMEQMINAAGHEVVQDVPSVRSLRNVAVSLVPDLALVDLQLAHGSSGLDAADYIRKTWPETAIVFVTANPRMLLPDIDKGDAVVPKPFSQVGLIMALAFIGDGLKDPPPSLPMPDNFVASPALRARWQLA